MDGSYHSHDIDDELSACCLDCEPGLALVKRHLLAFHERIARTADDEAERLGFDQIRALYAELDDVVRLHAPSERFVEWLLADTEVRTILPDLRAAYSMYFERHERDFAERLLQTAHPWRELERFTFYRNYVSLTDAESNLAGLRSGDRVAMIGCGPLPLTNILLASRHGLTTVGLEQDAELAKLAQGVVKALGVADGVWIVEGDHVGISALGEFDLIMVAAQAKPRRAVLEYLTQTLPGGSRISLRTYEKGLRRILADEAAEPLPEELLVVGSIDPGEDVNNTVLLLEVGL
jgi:hypothetical protein